MGRWSRGDAADIPFKEADGELTALLKEFGPPRRSFHPEYPFWRLQNDGVWVVHSAGCVCASMKPGTTVRPAASMIWVRRLRSLRMSAVLPTATKRPWWTAKASAFGV